MATAGLFKVGENFISRQDGYTAATGRSGVNAVRIGNSYRMTGGKGNASTRPGAR